MRHHQQVQHCIMRPIQAQQDRLLSQAEALSHVARGKLASSQGLAGPRSCKPRRHIQGRAPTLEAEPQHI